MHQAQKQSNSSILKSLFIIAIITASLIMSGEIYRLKKNINQKCYDAVYTDARLIYLEGFMDANVLWTIGVLSKDNKTPLYTIYDSAYKKNMYVERIIFPYKLKSDSIKSKHNIKP